MPSDMPVHVNTGHKEEEEEDKRKREKEGKREGGRKGGRKGGREVGWEGGRESGGVEDRNRAERFFYLGIPHDLISFRNTVFGH